MNVRRFVVLVIFLFLLFLGIYTWNARTGKWDALGSHLGLELSSSVLRMVSDVENYFVSGWENYWDLVDVKQDNLKLQNSVDNLKQELVKEKEKNSELERLRKLLSLQSLMEWEGIGAQVLAWRFGSNDFLESLILSKGYLNGAKPATPLVVADGLLGRVLKAGPYTSIGLLITDPGSNVSVISSATRVQGIVQGQGSAKLLVMRFVKQNEEVKVGDTLLTSGMDLSYPKGIPVAKVVSVKAGADAMLEIFAEPLVDFQKAEEVLLLQNPFKHILPQGSPVYSRQKDEFSEYNPEF